METAINFTRYDTIKIFITLMARCWGQKVNSKNSCCVIA